MDNLLFHMSREYNGAIMFRQFIHNAWKQIQLWRAVLEMAATNIHLQLVNIQVWMSK